MMTATDVRLALLERGFACFPAASMGTRKACYVEGWPTLEVTRELIESWQTRERESNTAVRCDDLTVIDIDILTRTDLNVQIKRLALEILGPTPFIRVGLAPKCALFYRGSFKLNDSSCKIDPSNQIEVLSGTAKLITVHGRHLVTGKPYLWTGGKTLWETNPDEIPELNLDTLREFGEAVVKILPRPAAGEFADDPDLIRDAQGYIVDGRESFMRDCIYFAARELHDNNLAITVDAVFERGWKLFLQEARDDSERWTEREAYRKANAIVRKLNAGGLTFPPRTLDPTYPTTNTMAAEAARDHLDNNNLDFIEAARTDPRHIAYTECVPTGVGKTRLMAKAIAQSDLKVFLAVPTHRLGEDIADTFRKEGTTARVIRGRDAKEPGTDNKMCLNQEQTNLAEAIGVSIYASCCKSGNNVCKFYDECAYFRQFEGDEPQVTIFAHQLLFHEQKLFSEFDIGVIDESFLDAGVEIEKNPMELDKLDFGPATSGPDFDPVSTTAMHASRAALVGALRRHPNGALEAKFLDTLTVEQCERGIELERKWAGKPVRLWPGMPTSAIHSQKFWVPFAQDLQRILKLWYAIKELLEGVRAVDAHFELDNGKIKYRGVRRIVKQYQKPTLVMDATLPGLEILKPFFVAVKPLADLEVTTPYMRVRQVINAPVSKQKFETNRNPKLLRRYIMKRWMEVGRQPTLVITQKDFKEELKLPAEIAIEHFNNIGGIDRYRDVRLLITVGRNQPGPEAAETYAAALTGVVPQKVGRWFNRVVRGIRLADGTGRAVRADQHPDPTAEAVRWQQCEAELMQAIGRGRGVNREADTPLDVDILANVCLPLTVDEAVQWEEPSAVVEMAAEGILLSSPTHMCACWPGVWRDRKAAWESLIAISPGLPPEEVRGKILYRFLLGLSPGLLCFRYQVSGQGQKPAFGFYDPAVLPDPRPWLEAHLGPLAKFEECV
jgi:hypothetical protein